MMYPDNRDDWVTGVYLDDQTEEPRPKAAPHNGPVSISIALTLMSRDHWHVLACMSRSLAPVIDLALASICAQDLERWGFVRGGALTTAGHELLSQDTGGK